MPGPDKLKINPFCGKQLLVQTGIANIIDVDATIKKLMLLCHKGEYAHFCRDSVFQGLSMAPIVSLFQVEAALEQALSSFSEGTNIVKKPELEFLLRLCVTRDLDKAFHFTRQ
jgi:tRNA threonylcarbamoyladenosine modification (KEOPS) complex Cgi121 subunit